MMQKKGQALSRFVGILRRMWQPLFAGQMIEPATLDSLYKLAYLITENERRAENLVIRAYVEVARSLACDRHGTNLRMLLFAALYRAFRAAPMSEGESAASTRREDDETLYGRARALIHSQEADLRFIIFLRHCESLSPCEIVEITGIPVSSISSQLLRFRKSAARLHLPTEPQSLAG